MSTHQLPAIDVVIPAHHKDFGVLRLAVRGALRYIKPVRFVYVVAAQPVKSDDPRVVWVPEGATSGLVSLTDVSARLSLHGRTAVDRAGWLYQQIVKLGAPDYLDDLSDTYMVLDADVVWLRTLRVAIDDTVRFPYTQAFENHPPYRQAYARLFGDAPRSPFSMVAHQMVYDRGLLGEMKRAIEARHGVAWWEAYVGAADPSEASSISEFDSYGHWVLDNHSEAALHRQLSYLNVPVIPGPLGRAIYARDYDFVAAHAWMRAPRWVRTAQIAAGLARDLASGATRGDTRRTRPGRGDR